MVTPLRLPVVTAVAAGPEQLSCKQTQHCTAFACSRWRWLTAYRFQCFKSYKQNRTHSINEQERTCPAPHLTFSSASSSSRSLRFSFSTRNLSLSCCSFWTRRSSCCSISARCYKQENLITNCQMSRNMRRCAAFLEFLLTVHTRPKRTADYIPGPSSPLPAS
jgi:hypothetical protein